MIKMEKIKKVVKWLLATAILAVFAFNVYSFISIKVLKNDLVTIGGYSVLEVISGSMEPTIHVGDLVIIDTKESDYKSGDIVTFVDVDGSFVTHRLVEIKDNYIVTKGDANESLDEAMPKDSLVGKCTKKVRYLGKIFSTIKKPFVLVLIFIIGLVLCIATSIDRRPKDVGNEEEFQGYMKSKRRHERMKEIKEKKARKK